MSYYDVRPVRALDRARSAYDDTRRRIRSDRADAYAQEGDYGAAERELMAYDREGAKAYGDLGERERQRRLESGIAREIGAGNFAGAETVATKEGSLSGMTAARTARRQITDEQRLTLYQALTQGLGELEAMAANNGQGYEQWLAEGQAAAQQDPSLAPLLRDLPPQWNPRIPSVMQRRIEGLRNSLMTPQQAADLEAKGLDRQFRDRQQGETERHNRAMEGNQAMSAQAAMVNAQRPRQAGGAPVRGPDARLLQDVRTTASSARGLTGMAREFAGYLDQQNTGPMTGNAFNPGRYIDTELQAMNALGSRMLGLMRPVGSGATSDFEQRIYAKGAPSVDKTREANREIIEGIERLGAIADARQFFYEDYVAQAGTLNGAERAFQQSPEFQALTRAAGAAPAARQAPQSQGAPRAAADMSDDELEAIANGGR